MHSSKDRLTYWVPTILIALIWLFGGANSVSRNESSLAIFKKLGYPDYFAVLLGSAQLLGVAAILFPVSKKLREWAYAGLVFDSIAAIISLVAVGLPILQITFPLTALTLVLISYRAWLGRLKTSEM